MAREQEEIEQFEEEDFDDSLENELMDDDEEEEETEDDDEEGEDDEEADEEEDAEEEDDDEDDAEEEDEDDAEEEDEDESVQSVRSKKDDEEEDDVSAYTDQFGNKQQVPKRLLESIEDPKVQKDVAEMYKKSFESRSPLDSISESLESVGYSFQGDQKQKAAEAVDTFRGLMFSNKVLREGSPGEILTYAGLSSKEVLEWMGKVAQISQAVEDGEREAGAVEAFLKSPMESLTVKKERHGLDMEKVLSKTDKNRALIAAFRQEAQSDRVSSVMEPLEKNLGREAAYNLFKSEFSKLGGLGKTTASEVAKILRGKYKKQISLGKKALGRKSKKKGKGKGKARGKTRGFGNLTDIRKAKSKRTVSNLKSAGKTRAGRSERRKLEASIDSQIESQIFDM